MADEKKTSGQTTHVTLTFDRPVTEEEVKQINYSTRRSARRRVVAGITTTITPSLCEFDRSGSSDSTQ